MARGNQQASNAATTAGGMANTYGGEAQGLFGGLAPQLQAMAAHPQGFSPADSATMDTAGQESAGGTGASAVGQGALRAARTRNAGGADAAIASGVRSAGQNLATAALGGRLANAKAKMLQQEGALHGLEGLYGTTASAGNQALSEVAQNVNANTQAENASWNWAKDLFVPILGMGANVAAAKLMNPGAP